MAEVGNDCYFFFNSTCIKVNIVQPTVSHVIKLYGSNLHSWIKIDYFPKICFLCLKWEVKRYHVFSICWISVRKYGKIWNYLTLRFICLLHAYWLLNPQCGTSACVIAPWNIKFLILKHYVIHHAVLINVIPVI